MTDNSDYEEQLETYDASLEEKSDRGQAALIVLIVLAGLASIVMLVSGSDVALKLALLAALWASVLGFFLVARYRWEAAERENELWMREEYYQAELSRVAAESAAANVPAVVDKSAEWEEIKAQLEHIRSQLDDLAGREFTYEPQALQAQARRIAEIEARYASVEEAAREEAVNFTQPTGGAPSASAIKGDIGTTGSSRQDNPLAALINEREQQAREQAPEPSPAPAPAPEPAPEPDPEPTFNTSSFQAVDWSTGEYSSRAHAHEAPVSSSEPQESKAPAAAPESQEPEAPEAPAEAPNQEAKPERHRRHGRRRSDGPREGAKTVAELLAEMQKGE